MLVTQRIKRESFIIPGIIKENPKWYPFYNFKSNKLQLYGEKKGLKISYSHMMLDQRYYCIANKRICVDSFQLLKKVHMKSLWWVLIRRITFALQASLTP